MIALLKRYLKSIQLQGVLGTVLAMAIMGGGSSVGLAGTALLWLAIMLLLSLVMLAVLVVRSRLPRRAKWCADVVEPLVGTDEEFCLLLRPFGYDGRLILPEIPDFDPGLPWWRRPAAAGVVQRTKHIEQVIADSVRTALGLKTYCVVDQSMLFAPRGLEYLRAHNDSWHRPVHQLIARAHTLILWLPPDLPVGQGLDWEVATIARLGLRSRVIFVLPPTGSDRLTGCPAAHRMFELAARLGQGADVPREDLRVHAFGLLDRLGGDMLLAKVRTYGDPQIVTMLPAAPGSRVRTVHATDTYGLGLVDLLMANRYERNLVGFKARYEAQRRPVPAPVQERPAAGPSGPCLICGTTVTTRTHRKTLIGAVALTILAVTALYAMNHPEAPQTGVAAPPVDLSTAAAAPVDPCVVGTWRETSYWHVVMVRGVASSGVSSGRLHSFAADGSGEVRSDSVTFVNTTADGETTEFVDAGRITFRFTTTGGRIAYTRSAATGTRTLRPAGTTETLPSSELPERYVCTATTMTLTGDESKGPDLLIWASELQRV